MAAIANGDREVRPAGDALEDMLTQLEDYAPTVSMQQMLLSSECSARMPLQ